MTLFGKGQQRTGEGFGQAACKVCRYVNQVPTYWMYPVSYARSWFRLGLSSKNTSRYKSER